MLTIQLIHKGTNMPIQSITARRVSISAQALSAHSPNAVNGFNPFDDFDHNAMPPLTIGRPLALARSPAMPLAPAQFAFNPRG